VRERLKTWFAAHGPRVLALTQRVFLVSAVIAIGVYLFRHAESLRPLLSARVALHMAGGALVLALLHPLIGIAFFQLQRFAGIRIELATSLAVYMRRIPARYLPGGIWHSVARYADMKFDAGVDGRALRRLFLLEMALVAVSGLLACGLGLAVFSPQDSVFAFAALQAAIGAAAASVTVVLVWRRAWKRLGLATVLFLLIWSAAAGAFALIAQPLLGACTAPTIMSTYLIAAVQGYLAIFAPQGWGVAEASYALLEPCRVGIPAVVAGFLLFRISAVAGDIVSYAVWAVVTRRSRESGQSRDQSQ
jgi:glycosyltransferase 2 family protein